MVHGIARKLLIFFSFLALLEFPSFAQTTVTLNGTSYTLYNHPRTFLDGPGGTLDTLVNSAYGSGGVATNAVSSNPAWEGLLNKASNWFSNYNYTDPNQQVSNYGSGGQAALAAMICYSYPSTTVTVPVVGSQTYCTIALYMLNNIELYVPLLCNNTVDGCGDQNDIGYGYGDSYGAVFYNEEWILAYELMYSQMNSGQRTTFADKWLNDISAFGGIDGSPSTSCTDPTVLNNSVSVTVTNNAIVASAPLFGSGQAIQTGYLVLPTSNLSTDYYAVPIVSVTDSEHASVISTAGWSSYTGDLIYRRGNFTAGDCGIAWLEKHARYSPSSISGTSNYPPYGGSFSGQSNNTLAQYEGFMAVFMSLIEADPNASSRSQYEVTTLYDDFYSNQLPIIETYWTGFHLMGAAYGGDRPTHTARFKEIIDISINGTPPSMGTIWDKDFLYHAIMNWAPSCANIEPQWGADGYYAYSFYPISSIATIGWIAPVFYVNHNANEGQWYNWILQNRLSICSAFGNSPGSSLLYTNSGMGGGANQVFGQEFSYLYMSPSFTATSPTVNAVVLNQVDGGGTTWPQGVLISRTGYSSITDTLLDFYGMGEYFSDHNFPYCGGSINNYCGYPGDYRIFKGIYMLTADGSIESSPFTTIASDYNGGGPNSNYMEIGGAYNLKAADGDTFPYLYSKMPLGIADSSNRYAYAMVDSSLSYVSSVHVTRVQRHLVDFKKSSTQQFIVVFDDAVTSSGEEKQAYLHYANNEANSGDTSQGNTTISGNKITSSYPGTGNSDATQLLTEILEPQGSNSVYVYNDSSSCSGTDVTYCVAMCASTTGSSCNSSNTEGQFITVHMPVAGSGNSLPTMEIIGTIDSNHTGVEIDGSSPKVAVFPLAGTTYTSASYTSGYSGTGQNLVAGLTPGIYSVTVNSSTVASNVSVTSTSDSLYFESTSGSVVVTQTSSGPAGSVIAGKTVQTGGTIVQ